MQVIREISPSPEKARFIDERTRTADAQEKPLWQKPIFLHKDLGRTDVPVELTKIRLLENERHYMAVLLYRNLETGDNYSQMLVWDPNSSEGDGYEFYSGRRCWSNETTVEEELHYLKDKIPPDDFMRIEVHLGLNQEVSDEIKELYLLQDMRGTIELIKARLISSEKTDPLFKLYSQLTLVRGKLRNMIEAVQNIGAKIPENLRKWGTTNLW